MQDPMVTTHNALSRVIDECREGGAVGIDTEFVWERTYYPKLGVIQLATSQGGTYLIDAVALTDLSPLGDLMADTSVVKVLHDAVQDLVIVRRVSGKAPVNMFDTRVAAGFCGYRASLSLQELVKVFTGVVLSKSETRTDWIKRPLSDRQIEYAIDDVRYLLQLRERLMEKARDAGREGWLREELQALDDASIYEERNVDEQYLRVKGIGRVPARDVGALQAVTAWREEEARTSDLPRRHVMPDEVLVRLARMRPRKHASFRQVRGLPPKILKDRGDALIEVLIEGDRTQITRDPRPSPPSLQQEVQTEFGLAFVRGKALNVGIDPALVGSRNDVREVVEENGKASALASGWRKAFVGEELLAVLRGERALRLDKTSGLPLIEGAG